METVALLGTGLLGSGFARALLRKGHTVRVWNRSITKAEALAEAGAIVCGTAAEAAEGASRVHLVLAEDTAVDAVIAALRPGLGAGVTIVDHSTNAPARVAARAAALAEEGVAYVHAPVFMNPKNALDSTGIMVVSGSPARVEPVRAALESMTGSLWVSGEEPERAAMLKLAGNGMLLALGGVVGDLYAMADHAGFRPADVDALFQRFNPASMIGYIGQRVATGGIKPASFELSMARKDVRLMLETAGGSEDLAVLPGVAAAMDRAIAAGRADEDYGVYGWWRKNKG